MDKLCIPIPPSSFFPSQAYARDVYLYVDNYRHAASWAVKTLSEDSLGSVTSACPGRRCSGSESERGDSDSAAVARPSDSVRLAQAG
jgi:hypothetical protein